jgi:sulfur-oxidizing protein SoxZ
MKLKAKLKDGVAEIKVLAEHPMVGKEEAELKKVERKYITHITAKVGGKVVFEASTGPFLSKDPYFKFDVKGVKAGDKIVVDWVDTAGATKTAEAEIK